MWVKTIRDETEENEDILVQLGPEGIHIWSEKKLDQVAIFTGPMVRETVRAILDAAKELGWEV